MREKGGLHMEKMEHMDPQRCDRIWQRVSPELDPYPEVRAACREPSREPGAENIPERTGAAAVPAAPEIPAEPAESGCCLAGRAMGSIRLIQDFIEDELADRRAYLAYAACAPNVAARRLLRQLAGEEGSHARRLMGVYYLVTGCCYQPRLQGGGWRVCRGGRCCGLGITPRPAAVCAMHRRQRPRRTCVCGRYGRSCRRRNIVMPGSC